jgi:hypothetical protein
MPDAKAARVTTVRLSASVDARLDALLAPLSAAPPPELQVASRICKSDLLRLAILRGLATLEAEATSHPVLPGLEA